MNQQIKQLQQAKKMLNKARGEAEAAQTLLRRSRADQGLTKELTRGIDCLRRAGVKIDEQCVRIERKLARQVAANEDTYHDTATPDAGSPAAAAQDHRR